MKITSSRIALLCAMSSLSSVAFAQTSPPAATTADTIVITASRTDLTAREIGSAITSVTEQDIKDGQILQVKEVLQDIPGVQISDNRPGGFSNVSIRGSDNDQVLFLIDGIELGDPSSTSTQFQTDHLTSLDVSRIEVLRGNQSSLYGSDAIGGVVNIITQRAKEDGFHVNAEAEAGSEGVLGGGATLIGKSNGVDYRVTATAYQADGPSLSDPKTGTATEDDGYDRKGLSGRVGTQLGANFEAQLVGFYSQTSSDLDNTTSDSANTVDKDEYAYALQVKHATDDQKWRSELTLSRYNAERKYFGSFNLPEGDLYDGTKDAANFITNYKLNSQVQLAGGLSYEKEETDQVTNFSGNFNASITTKSVFAELAFRPTEALSFTLAGRVDDNSRFGQFDTYRVTGAYYVPNMLMGGDVKFRASYGTGAKAPGLYQLFDPTYGDDTLEVEESEGYDAGVDLIWDKVELELTAFSTDVTNEIGFDGSLPPFGGYANFGATVNKGVEFGARVEITPTFRLTQSLTALDAQNDQTDRWKGRPRYSGSTSAVFDITPQWHVTARARYRTENKSSFGGATEGFQVFDLMTSYDISDQLAIYARIENVTDKQYQLSYGSNTPDRGFFAGLRYRM